MQTPCFMNWIKVTVVGSAMAFSQLNATIPADAGGLPDNGKKLAEVWCSSCHLVSDDQVDASADVPSFKFIADKYKSNMEAAGAFLVDPHPEMPNFNLTRNEIQDLLAYIDSMN